MSNSQMNRGHNVVIDPGGAKTRKKQLPKSLSVCNFQKTETLKKLLKRSILQHKTVGFPHTLGRMTTFNIRLPDLSSKSKELRDFVVKELLDGLMQRDLEEIKVINFCRTIQKLYALRTEGDGNCLLHAVSIAMWGFHDKAMLLRRLVYISLVEDVGTKAFYSRWERERCRQNDEAPQGVTLSSLQWLHEWDMIVQAAEDMRRVKTQFFQLPFESLEEIHIFVLANVIQRPIIVLSENIVKSVRGSILGPNTFGGIYLPLLWDASKCTKTPIVLGYHMGHFTPLVNMETTQTDTHDIVGEYVVPLVNKDMEPIHIHFLSVCEENDANSILQKYLKVTEINWTKSDGFHLLLSAKIEHNKIEDKYDLMVDFIRELNDSFHDEQSPENKDISAKVPDEQSGLYLWNTTQSVEEPAHEAAAVPGTAVTGHSRGSNSIHSKQAPVSHSKPTAISQAYQNNMDISHVHHKRAVQAKRLDQLSSHAELKLIRSGNKCIKIGCTYHGSIEYGGYCYLCFLESTRTTDRMPSTTEPSPVFEYQPSIMNERCAYTIPCYNMASTRTYPHCHEHATVAQSSSQTSQVHHCVRRRNTTSGYVPSITNYQCHYRGCRHAASTKWFPYCNEHQASHKTTTPIPLHQQTSPRYRDKPTELVYPSALSITPDRCAAVNCANRASKNTYPYCHEHEYYSQDEMGPSLYTVSRPQTETERDLPMIYRCTQLGCNNFASYRTFPVCVEHHVQQMPPLTRKASDASPMAPKHRSSGSLPHKSTQDPELFSEEEKSRSLNSITIGPSQRCPEPGCTLYGPPAAQYYCEQHQVLRKLGQLMTTESTNDMICSKPGCDNKANPKYGHLCSNCFLLDEFADDPPLLGDEDLPSQGPVKLPSVENSEERPDVSHKDETAEGYDRCVGPYCPRWGNPKLRGLCDDCYTALSQLKHTQASEPQPIREPDTKPSREPQPIREPDTKPRREPRPIREPNTKPSREPHTDPASPKNAQPSPCSSTTARSTAKLGRPTNTRSITKMGAKPVVQTKQAAKSVIKTQASTNNTTPDGATELSVPLDKTYSIMPCITDGCNLLGSADTDYYCLACYSNLAHKPHPVLKMHLSQKLSGKQFTFTENSMSSGIPCCHGEDSPDSATHAKDCRYGKSKVKTIVNRVDNKHPTARTISKYPFALNVNKKGQDPKVIMQSTPHVGKHEVFNNSTDDIGDSTEALRKIEESVRKSRHCKTKRCDNFGNPMKNGYCNSCHPRILGEASA